MSGVGNRWAGAARNCGADCGAGLLVQPGGVDCVRAQSEHTTGLADGGPGRGHGNGAELVVGFARPSVGRAAGACSGNGLGSRVRQAAGRPQPSRQRDESLISMPRLHAL